MGTLIINNDSEDHILDLLACAHASINHTDTVAALIAARLGIDPSDEIITEVVWNISDAKEAMKFLKGEPYGRFAQSDAPVEQRALPAEGS